VQTHGACRADNVNWVMGDGLCLPIRSFAPRRIQRGMVLVVFLHGNVGAPDAPVGGRRPAIWRLALMAGLAREGQTMIVVTHSMHFARSVANRVHVFADGYDVESGSPDVVFGDPQHTITQSFLKQVK
jgi:ABC-type phosphonate transport system ATPase subunit